MPLTRTLCLDGLLNATVFHHDGAAYACGRVRERGPLAVCTIEPTVEHKAYIEQPEGHSFEDPRYLGVHDGCLAFICADGVEYFTQYGDHSIYQAVLYIDPATWTLRDFWRLQGEGVGRYEKNWVPIGEVTADGTSTLLYSHQSLRRLTVDHGARTLAWVADTSAALGNHAVTDVRGGTPLVAHPNGGWWGLAHTVDARETRQHPVHNCVTGRYRTTYHQYTDALATVDAAHTRSPCTAPAAFIEYACGLVVLDDGEALVSMGLQDISTVFVWAQQDHWATPDAPSLDLSTNRFTYCDGVIPTAPYAPTGTPTLCLNMIVKNESRIIERQLATVTPILDAYCICDTGSTDDTVARIHAYFERAGIPGRVVQHPFVNFGHNRSVALRAAQDLAEYTLLLDADMKLVIDQGFDKTHLTKDVYTVEQGSEAFSYRNVRLLRTSIGATCVGATHEYYGYADTCSTGHLTTLRIDDVGDGGCKANKFERDIRLLTADVEADPGNGRAHFYLANSYKDTQQWAKAVTHYTKRIELGGWYEEVWYSYYALGKCYQAQGEHAQAIETWLRGYNHYPKRSENLYEIVKHYRETGKSELASQFYRWAAAIPEPRTDALFLHHDVYQYLLTYEFTVFYYYLQDKSVYPPDAIHRALFAMLHYDHNLCNVLCNYQFYARSLKDAPSAAITRLTHTVEAALPDGFPRTTFDDSTPAACVLKGGDTLTNVRYNNTVIDDAWGYHMREAREVTYNVWVRTDATGAVVASGWMRDPETDVATDDTSDRFAGRQDVRLLVRRDGTVVYTATVCGAPDDTIDANVTSGVSKVFRIEYGVYDTSLGHFEGTTMLSPTQAECEKNWCLFETPAGDLKCVYSWYPLVVGRLESDTFVEEHRSTEAKVLRRARGSSHGVPHGDALWFLVHLVSYETPRRYYHAVVVTDAAGTRVQRVSYPFTLEGEPIEYCGSLSVDNTHLTLHYSVKDAAARSMRVPQAAVRWGYRVAGEARETVWSVVRGGKVGSQQMVAAV